MAKRRRPTKAKGSVPAQVGGRGLQVVQARYDAAGFGRRMRGWSAPASGPNRAIQGAHVLRNRARDAGRNEWAGASGARVWSTSLIGVGILARPMTKDAALKARLVAWWDAWTKVCDADCVLDFYGLQTLATRSWIESGEVFVRARPRRVEDGLPVPLQIQLLESDMVPALDRDLPNGHRIRSGIELDRIGRRVAYWMHREHPGDGLGSAVSLTDLSRVPADQVRHVFEPRRPGQLRGVTEFAPILAKLRGVMDFDDAVLERQKLANLFTLFITKPPGGDPQIDPLTGQARQLDAGGPIAALEPGISQELLPGEGVEFSEPPDAGAGYADFMRQQSLGVAAGQGTPHELLTGDLRDVSDRTLRVIINEFRRHCEQRQWQIIIPLFCQAVREWWADAALMAGVMNPAEHAEAKRVAWAPHGWAYIHPVQDVQAKRIEQDMGIKSRSQIITERGDDPDQVDEERAADAEREERLGLVQPGPESSPPPDDGAAARAHAAALNACELDQARDQAAHAARLRAIEMRMREAEAARAEEVAEAEIAAAQARARVAEESAARVAAAEEERTRARSLAEQEAQARAAERAAERAEELHQVRLATERAREEEARRAAEIAQAQAARARAEAESAEVNLRANRAALTALEDDL